MTRSQTGDRTMGLLTPEIVERAAEAIELVESHSSEDYARAALEAVIPSLIEECAKVADEKAKPWKMKVESEQLMGCVVYDSELYVIQILAELARDIRSLIPSKEKK